MEKSENIEAEIGRWLKLDTTRLFEKVIPRPHGMKRIRIDKSWSRKDGKLVIG